MTIEPTRRTFVRAAAWTVPAVTVAAAAPAFAASPVPIPAPDLSTSVLGSVPVRQTPNTLYIPSFGVTNSGSVATTSITFTFTSTVPLQNIQIKVPFSPDPVNLGAPWTTAPTPAFPATSTSFTLLQFGTIAPGATLSSVMGMILTFPDAMPTDLTIDVVATNTPPGPKGTMVATAV